MQKTRTRHAGAISLFTLGAALTLSLPSARATENVPTVTFRQHGDIADTSSLELTHALWNEDRYTKELKPTKMSIALPAGFAAHLAQLAKSEGIRVSTYHNWGDHLVRVVIGSGENAIILEPGDRFQKGLRVQFGVGQSARTVTLARTGVGQDLGDGLITGGSGAAKTGKAQLIDPSSSSLAHDRSAKLSSGGSWYVKPSRATIAPEAVARPLWPSYAPQAKGITAQAAALVDNLAQPVVKAAPRPQSPRAQLRKTMDKIVAHTFGWLEARSSTLYLDNREGRVLQSSNPHPLDISVRRNKRLFFNADIFRRLVGQERVQRRNGDAEVTQSVRMVIDKDGAYGKRRDRLEVIADEPVGTEITVNGMTLPVTKRSDRLGKERVRLYSVTTSDTRKRQGGTSTLDTYGSRWVTVRKATMGYSLPARSSSHP